MKERERERGTIHYATAEHVSPEREKKTERRREGEEEHDRRATQKPKM